MADSVEQQNIRGLNVQKTIQGFALCEYVFKSDCEIVSISADQVRYYTETAADLTATAPSVIANISPLSIFPTLETSWTRNTLFPRKYAAEGFISMEDIKTAEIDVLARSLLRITRSVTKAVDTRIFSVLSVGYVSTQASALTAALTINAVQTTAPWSTASYTGVDIIKDIMAAKRMIWVANYNPEGASLYLSPKDYESLVSWLISSKGSSIPNFSSERISSGVVMNILGLNVKVSNNVTASGALVVIPKQAATWYSVSDTTARVIEEPGIGSKIRVWENGDLALHDPLAVTLIYGTQT